MTYFVEPSCLNLRNTLSDVIGIKYKILKQNYGLMSDILKINLFLNILKRIINIM